MRFWENRKAGDFLLAFHGSLVAADRCAGGGDGGPVTVCSCGGWAGTASRSAGEAWFRCLLAFKTSNVKKAIVIPLFFHPLA